MSICAVIRVTKDNEPYHIALASIRLNRRFVNQVILEHPTFPGGDTPEGVERIVSQLKPTDILNSNSVLAFIPPTCSMTQGCFEQILATSDTLQAHQTQFGVETKSSVGNSPWVGFFIILYAWQWLWRSFERGKFINYTDIRCCHLIRKGNAVHLPPEHLFSWRIRNDSTLPSVDGRDLATLDPVPSLMWALRMDRYMSWGLWLLPFFSIWSFSSFAWFQVFAIWNWRINLLILAAWISIVIVCFFTTKNKIVSRLHLLYSLLSPIYLFLFPFVLVSGRLS